MARKDFLTTFVEKEIVRDPDFRKAWESEIAAEQRAAELMSVLAAGRRAQKISQAVVAKDLGVSQPRIAQIEKTGDISVHQLIDLATRLGYEVQVTPKTGMATGGGNDTKRLNPSANAQKLRASKGAQGKKATSSGGRSSPKKHSKG